MKKTYTAPEAERIGFVSQQNIAAVDFDTILDIANGDSSANRVIEGDSPSGSEVLTN